RCHVIGNLFNDGRAFRWKPAVRETVFQGNVCVGTLYCTGTKSMGWTDPSQRMIVRNNTIVGGVAWAGEPLGPDGFNGDWATADKAALNNFVANHDAKAIESARFADPAYNDYRLQSDSPLIGLALAGGDRGAFRQASGRILYVGQKGADSAPGTSERLAFKTFARACAELRPGDTLYVLDALYREPLVVLASGAPAQPIRIRAYQRRSSALPGIVLAGSHLHLEGFRVRQSPGDGILVKGGDVRVERCRVDRAAGAGLRADGAKGLTVNHCTFVSNDCGVALVNGSTEATLRNSIVAQNRTTTMTVDESSQTGYRGYNTCYFGPGLDAQRVAAETDSLVADPRFVTPDRNDYRLTWDSPARYLGEFGRPAGSESVVQRTVQIHGVATRNLQPESAVVSWQTPEDDTLGRVRFKPKGAGEWQTVQSVEQGTEHAIGLVGLQPGTAYEFQATAVARRGGEATSEALTFRTPTESRPPAELYVSPTGNDAADGRSPATAWRTVRKACIEALPGDTVRVAPGVYHDPI
ncbi:MAG: hypothetical protein FJ279_38060, partial [Planctomycetes bacterium]|nr:hypothetical protein [Planctomycetota bacterium]